VFIQSKRKDQKAPINVAKRIYFALFITPCG
jgi:hypothetical protein